MKKPYWSTGSLWLCSQHLNVVVASLGTCLIGQLLQAVYAYDLVAIQIFQLLLRPRCLQAGLARMRFAWWSDLFVRRP